MHDTLRRKSKLEDNQTPYSCLYLVYLFNAPNTLQHTVTAQLANEY